MKQFSKYILFLLLYGVLVCKAQTVNDGQLYVSPKTVMTLISNFDNKVLGEYENNGDVLFKGNFNNDGIVTYNPLLSGNTFFEGFTQQDIKGSVPADFNNVIFKNNNSQPAFRLYADISINGNADFSKGIIDSDNYGGVTFFGDVATHTKVSNDSFIDGMVIKNGSSDFIFPIGDHGHYRFSGISMEGNSASSFSSKYFLENSNNAYPHTNKETIIDLIDDKEYWVVEKASGQQDVLLTLTWDDGGTTPANIFNVPENLHVVRWDSQKNLWLDEGGAVDKDQKAVTTITKVKGYGVFTLAKVKSTAPSKEDIIVYNAISPNGDGRNEYFVIDGIKKYPNNKVTIYNRWGIKVFETTGYDTKDNVFNGISENNMTISPDKKLPPGTYFYVIEYDRAATGETPKKISKTGYLYISK